MAEKPIIFSTSMVRAILEGRKTMTRRVATSDRPRYQVGDRLWVKEAWQRTELEDEEGNVVDYIYKADDTGNENSYSAWGIAFKSPWFMPKAAARIWLEVRMDGKGA